MIQTVGMALANAINVQQATGLTGADSTVNFLPLFHTAGINLHTLPVFLAGGTNIVLARFEVDPLLDLIAAGRISLFFGVPAIYQALSLSPRLPDTDLSKVRHWGCGGAPLSESLIRAFLARGVRVCNGMGMTETGPTVFLMDPAHAVEKIGSVGKPQLMSEVRLVDAEGRDVAPGERGEILFRGPNITPGYFNNPGATASAIDRDGWLHSGDVGRRDADGYYFIVDRIKDMYISGGENVYPAEVEAVLTNHAAVLEAAVIGVPDERWGEVGHAAVRLRPGAACEPEELRAFARSQLAAYKVPKHVTIVEDYPRTAAGKVQKHLLRPHAGAGTAEARANEKRAARPAARSSMVCRKLAVAARAPSAAAAPLAALHADAAAIAPGLLDGRVLELAERRQGRLRGRRTCRPCEREGETRRDTQTAQNRQCLLHLKPPLCTLVHLPASPCTGPHPGNGLPLPAPSHTVL